MPFQAYRSPICATLLALTAFSVEPRAARATAARSHSLLRHDAFPDESDLFFFPASVCLFVNAVHADFGPHSFSGSGDLLYHRKHGFALFLNRNEIGRTRLGSTDDISRTLNSISGTGAGLTDANFAGNIPTPDKVFDLMLAKPLQDPTRWIGLGVSFSHKSNDHGISSHSLTDDEGFPVALSYSQQARSTLLALLPGYTRLTDTARFETSIHATFSLFRISNKVLSDIPTNVPSDSLKQINGTVIGQAGPPSFGSTLRWMTRRQAPRINWVVSAFADRRDYDSASPPAELKTEADEIQLSVAGGPKWSPTEVVSLSIVGQAGFGQFVVSPNPGSVRRNTTITLPAIHGAAETRVSRYLSVRGAISQSYSWTYTRIPAPDTEALRGTQTQTNSSFSWALGVSGHYKALDLDASVQPQLITQGPAFLGGGTSDGLGTGLFSLLSLTYRFGEPQRSEEPQQEPSQPGSPGGGDQ